MALFTEQTCCFGVRCLICCRNSKGPRNKAGELQRYTHSVAEKACRLSFISVLQSTSVMQGKSLLCCELVVHTPSQVDRSNQGRGPGCRQPADSQRAIHIMVLGLASSCAAHLEARPASCRVTHLSPAILVSAAGWGLPCVYGHCPAAGRASQGCILSVVTGHCVCRVSQAEEDKEPKEVAKSELSKQAVIYRPQNQRWAAKPEALQSCLTGKPARKTTYTTATKCLTVKKIKIKKQSESLQWLKSHKNTKKNIAGTHFKWSKVRKDGIKLSHA